MKSRPRRKWNDRWRRQFRPAGVGEGLDVECLEPRFLLSRSTWFVELQPRPEEQTPAPAPSALTTGSVSESESARPAVSTPTTVTSNATGGPGPPSVVVAVTTPTASGATNVTVTPINSTDATINLPDVTSPSQVDVLSTVQAGNTFYLPNLDDAVSVNITLSSLTVTVPLAGSLDVFSASGKMFLVGTPSSSATTETLTVPISEVPDAAAGMFVRVESVPGFSRNMPPSPRLFSPYFLLGITRDEPPWLAPKGPFSGGSSSGGRSPVSGLPSPNSTTPPDLLSVLESYLEVNARALLANDQVPVLAAPVEQAAPLTLSASTPIGPLPARSAAPLGGVLATGDVVPQVDRRDAVSVDMELIGLLSGEPAASTSPLPHAIDPAVRLTTVRGPGGFPLLASAQERPVVVALGALPWAASPMRPEAKSEAENTLAPPPTVLPQNPEARTRPSVGAGLTLALSLAIGPELPNLAAAFQGDTSPGDRSHTRRRQRIV
jgi:hypothetical protein